MNARVSKILSSYVACSVVDDTIYKKVLRDAKKAYNNTPQDKRHKALEQMREVIAASRRGEETP